MRKPISRKKFEEIVERIENALGYDAMRYYLDSSKLRNHLDHGARSMFEGIMVAY